MRSCWLARLRHCSAASRKLAWRLNPLTRKPCGRNSPLSQDDAEPWDSCGASKRPATQASVAFSALDIKVIDNGQHIDTTKQQFEQLKRSIAEFDRCWPISTEQKTPALRPGLQFGPQADAPARNCPTGGKQKLGPISKQGDRYLRRILVVGAHSVLWLAKKNPEKNRWLTQLLARRPFKVVAIALANKMARVAWALLAKGGTYRVPALAAA